MRGNSGKLARAIFIPATATFVGSAAANLATADYVVERSAAAELQIGRRLAAESEMRAFAAEWAALEQTADIAERLLRRHERGYGRGGGRGNRRRPYVLGITGSGTEGEPELFEITTYFEKLGSITAMTGVAITDARVFLQEDGCRWLDLLADLRDRSLHERPALDGNRFEQLTHAVSALRLVCAEAVEARHAVASWQPLRLVEEGLTPGTGETLLRAVVQNDNIIDSPVPALRVAFRTHDGIPVGVFLVFPSDEDVPGNGEIVIRGRLPWPSEGVASGVTLVRDPGDFLRGRGLEDRFPGPGGGTRDG